MLKRDTWIKNLNKNWKKRSLIWLSGVRRIGKTTLTKMLPKHLYLNCELPSVLRRLEDPEVFYNNLNNQKYIVFDEIHRLVDPSLLLKIGTDEFSKIKIFATGSSTLEATSKFKDNLTGRKQSLYLPPVLWSECLNDFNMPDFDHRLLFGGFPEVLLSSKLDSSFFAEWIDSFYARDIQELFNIRNRTGFLSLLKLLLLQSGGLLEVTQLSKHAKISRPTVQSHLEALQISHVVTLLPPFYGGGRREIIRRPKVYGFDTGIISFIKGWTSIREEDRGYLWEHLVLDVLRVSYLKGQIFYWRDKSNYEIDFVLQISNKNIMTIECKINPDKYETKALRKFREIYKKGKNVVVCPHVRESYKRKIDGFLIEFCSIENLLL